MILKAKERGDAPEQVSPLVIDLDADGIELTAFNAETTTTFFDIDGDPRIAADQALPNARDARLRSQEQVGCARPDGRRVR